MGKPSSTSISRKSLQSENSKMGKEKALRPTQIAKAKNRIGKRKRVSKANKSITKLFEHLREATQDITNNSIESVIDLDDTQNTVITIQENSNAELRHVADNLIVIDEDAKTTPKKQISLHHSTPIAQKKDLDTFILHSNNNISNQNLNATREINRDSYVTIDLTAETGFQNSGNQTVIDLENESDCGLASNASMSGDSDVTVLRQSVSTKFKSFRRRIANLNDSDKGKILEMIAESIFKDSSVKTGVPNLQKHLPRAPETEEDTYIKQVILGGASRCSVGSNCYRPGRDVTHASPLRMIVIDGSNVAMEHGRGHRFSVRGLQICIEYFLRRGHVVKAFVPRFRCKANMSTDGRLLDYLERQGLVIYTPSRQIQGRTITPYDDRYIIQCAAEFDGVVVSGDNYRDLIHENPKWRFVIENRILPFTWVDDMIMFPRDPLGRNGPTLEQFLRHPDTNK